MDQQGDDRGLIALPGPHWPRAPNGTETWRIVEPLAAIPDTVAPDETVVFMLSYEAAVEDADARFPCKHPDARLGPARAAWRVEPRARPTPKSGRTPVFVPPDDAARRAHLARVEAARELLLDGVIYQANLAHRLVAEPASFDDGLAFFLTKTAHDVPGCAAFVDVPGFGSLVSLSPERFVMADFARHEARSYPIKGTRPAGQLAALLASDKDRAEHVMIVDLLRNDLGALAVPGGVTVERLLEPITLPTLHHLESTIFATLRDDVTVNALLRATAPGGSITGAPKSSAIESIYALEDGPRGPYTGVLGVMQGPRLWSSLLIRTWIRPDGAEGSLHVGGGIVADSDAALEWDETLTKASSFAKLT